MRHLPLLLLLSLISFGAGAPTALAQDAEVEAANAFYEAGYTWCDAQHLAAHWGKGEAWDAKVAMGNLLKKGKGKKVTKSLTPARQMADANGSICEYETNYAYEDAEALAQVWGMETWDAKVNLSKLVRSGQRASVDEALSKARSAMGDPNMGAAGEEVPVFDEGVE
jgi:hypothetical protein